MQNEIKVAISPSPHLLSTALEFEFSRINVIMGRNGIGKSTIVKEMAQHPNFINSTKYIEGGRVIGIPSSIELSSHEYDHLGSYEKADNAYIGGWRNPLSTRLKTCLTRLDQRQQKLKNEYADKIKAWLDGGRSGKEPQYPEPPLNHVFDIFNSIFPEITLTLEGPKKILTCNKSGNVSYQAAYMSDGEKQVFGIIADLIHTEERLTTILVDEPELNLNPELAIQLWEMLEKALPGVTFIYATHNLSFALRQNVEKLFIITSRDKMLHVSNSFADLDQENARQFLGAIPSIVVTKNALIVEGKESSFDKEFYSWLLGDAKPFKIFPEGSCKDVLSTLKRADFWAQLAPNAKLTGIIDRDYNSINAIRDYQRMDGVVVLALHEAESYLCLPEFLADIDEKVKVTQARVTIADLKQEIVDFAEARKVRVVLTKMISDIKGLTIDRTNLSKLNALDAAKAYISKIAVNDDALHVHELLKKLEKEIQNIDVNIKDRNINKLLRDFPGKELLPKLTEKIGLTPTSLLNAINGHEINPLAYVEIKKLVEKIKPELI